MIGILGVYAPFSVAGTLLETVPEIFFYINFQTISQNCNIRFPKIFFYNFFVTPPFILPIILTVECFYTFGCYFFFIFQFFAS